MQPREIQNQLDRSGSHEPQEFWQMNWNFIIERCERISEYASAIIVGLTYGCVAMLIILWSTMP